MPIRKKTAKKSTARRKSAGAKSSSSKSARSRSRSSSRSMSSRNPIGRSSSREESDLVKGYQLGANAYVVKPVDFDQFIGAVTKLGVFWALVNEPPPTA